MVPLIICPPTSTSSHEVGMRFLKQIMYTAFTENLSLDENTQT
jgi:hypothetical protein